MEVDSGGDREDGVMDVGGRVIDRTVLVDEGIGHSLGMRHVPEGHLEDTGSRAILVDVRVHPKGGPISVDILP